MHVTLVHRRAALGDSIKYWVRPDIDNRIKEGSIAARFESRVVEIRPTEIVIERRGTLETLPAEAVFLLTGYHPDVELMRRAGIECDPETLAPTLNPGDVRVMCRTCSSPAARWPARTPATSSSRMGGFTANGSSRSCRIGGFRRPETCTDLERGTKLSGRLHDADGHHAPYLEQRKRRRS